MSKNSLALIITRINSATKKSPISVFMHPSSEPDFLEAVFGQTAESVKRIREKDPLFVGNFHKNQNADWVRRQLNKALKDERNDAELGNQDGT